MRQLIVVGLLAFAVALTGTAYAEVQNIKVSGDLDIKGITHHNYDLKLKQKNESGHTGVGTITNDDTEDFALSTLHIKIDADLTDNVSTSVRLLNQRKWDIFTAGDEQIAVDNAYVTLREFLYSPLTLIVGRQNLVYGSGFIVGNGLLADPEGVFASTSTGAGAQLTGEEYSAFNSFDAVRAILDFSTLTVEGVMAIVNETGVANDDENLYGVLANYKLDRWEAEVEPYWFYKSDESGAKTITVNDSSSALGVLRAYESNKVHTVGIRTAATPVENLRISAEGAHQFGELRDTSTGAGITQSERNRSAWAANIYANYTWAQAPWTPATGLGWTFYSGEEPSGTREAADLQDRNDTFNAWEPMYRGSFTTYIQDFLTGADAPLGLYTTFDTNDTAATTNRHLIYGDLKLNPMKDITLWARYTHAMFDEAPRPGRSHDAGDELDAKLLYDYTEDVQLALFGGWFFPGHYYEEPASSSLRGDDLAWTAGGGGSVKF